MMQFNIIRGRGGGEGKNDIDRSGLIVRCLHCWSNKQQVQRLQPMYKIQIWFVLFVPRALLPALLRRAAPR